MWKSSVIISLLLSYSAVQADTLINPDNYRSLMSDRRAYQIGDTLTVMVLESTTAESAAGTGAKSNTDITATANNSDNNYKAGVGISGNTNGTGQTSRRGQVRTNVAVRISEVLPNGLLKVQGEQKVTINNEKQHIKIAGVVRADDISYDNTILSNRLADAHIDIIGDGVVSDAQRQNIIFRMLKWLRIL